MNDLLKSRTKTTGIAKLGLKTALCEALFAYVQSKTGFFSKSVRNNCLFWANY